MAQAVSLRLITRETIADGVVDMRFALLDPPSLTFRAGQFMTLAVGKDAAGRDLRRSYSIASRSDAGDTLRFIIRILPQGVASDFWRDLAVGAQVEMTGPHGFFTLDPTHAGDVVFAATGTGLAPVLPMLAELAQRTETGRRVVFWGLRREVDLFVPGEVNAACAEAGATLHTYLSGPENTWPGERGRIIDPVLTALPTWNDPTFYIVGNGSMIAELKKALMGRGIDRKKRIRTEAFFD
jgi:CDP-4-dehydro-6-deoxyglucose reductase, E3